MSDPASSESTTGSGAGRQGPGDCQADRGLNAPQNWQEAAEQAGRRRLLASPVLINGTAALRRAISR